MEAGVRITMKPNPTANQTNWSRQMKPRSGMSLGSPAKKAGKRSWVSGVNLGVAACTYIFGDGSGTHSDPRTRRVGWSAVIVEGVSNYLGQTLERWKSHSERLMNSLKNTGGWMGTLGEGGTCVVAAESTRGNVVYVTDCEILKKRQDRGWPTPRLGQGGNPDLWWRMSWAPKTRQGTFTV